MQSIGLTDKQMIWMLYGEGFYYILCVAGLIFTVGAVVLYGVKCYMENSLSYFVFRWPIIWTVWICQVKCVNFFIFYRRSDLDRRFDVISLIGIIIGKASHILPHRAVGVLVNQNKSHQFEENTDSSSHAVRSLFLLLTSHQTNPVILSRLAKH